MKIIAGIDVGNSTTEAAIAEVDENNKVKFISQAITKTTGVKGTTDNVKGIIESLSESLKNTGYKVEDIDVIRINQAAPVIGATAMETITETIITDSNMIGHNPETPGGIGIGKGTTVILSDIFNKDISEDYIVVVPKKINYEEASKIINKSSDIGYKIKGAILSLDEGVLVSNRVKISIPIVDEVTLIEKVPMNSRAVVEVADLGNSIRVLSDPYGIASMFNLDPDETKRIIPIAKSLIGNRSAVVIKTPKGEVKEKIIPAGNLYLKGKTMSKIINVDKGAEEIMKSLLEIDELIDVEGEKGTNVGGMLSNVKDSMAKLTFENVENVKIKDILAIDTITSKKVTGAIAGEIFMEKAVAIAAMVKTEKLPMEKVAEELIKKTGSFVKVAGVEAVMAVLGAMTTPGVKLPLAILDLGGGSTDAALMDEKGRVSSVHLAGAGELVTMIINSELGLNNRELAEDIKKYPVAKVESLFSLRMENREVKFFKEPINEKFFGRVVICKEELIPIYKNVTMEKIIEVRRTAKERVFVENSIRALKNIASFNNIRNIPNIVLVGGSALDFEIPDLILNSIWKYNIVSGRGNIRGILGPRNAVATGLVMSYMGY